MRVLQRLRGGFKKSFHRKLFLALFLVSFLPMLISGMLSVRLFRLKIASDYAVADREQAGAILERINSFSTALEEVAAEIAEDEAIRAMLKGDEDNPRLVYRSLYSQTVPVRSMSTAELYRGGECTYSTGQGSVKKSLPQSFGILRRAAQAEGEPVYMADLSHIQDEGDGFLMGQLIYDGEVPGFVVFRISGEDIEELLKGTVGVRDSVLILNRFMEPVFSMGETGVDNPARRFRENLLEGNDYNKAFDGNTYISEIGSTGFYLVYITQQAVTESAVSSMYRVVMLLSLTSLVLCIMASYILSGSMLKPLEDMTGAMGRLRGGDLDTRIEMDWEDEFGELSEGFNRMADRISTMMEERVENQKELDRVQMEMIHEQLNPHFLYNTLDTIKWVAKSKGVPEIGVLSSKLARILRQSISEKQFCTLEDELEMLKSYCDIQSFRFDDRFEVTYRIQDIALEAIIPKLLLQPIVENAIIHGVQGMDDGKIEISSQIHSVDRILKLFVKDNGVGISDDYINKFESGDDKALSGHIGMKNVDRLLKLNYGSGYGLKVGHRDGGGTVVCLKLPFKTGVRRV